MSIKDEIKQTKPISLKVEAALNIQRTSDVLLRGVAEVLKPAGLSPTQYNVLRILRGAGAEGLACREIGERMVTRDPDITRLLDRMEHAGLVKRERGSTDRRVVTAWIAPKGREIVESLEKSMRDLEERQFVHLGSSDLRTLIRLLETVRKAGT